MLAEQCKQPLVAWLPTQVVEGREERQVAFPCSVVVEALAATDPGAGFRRWDLGSSE